MVWLLHNTSDLFIISTVVPLACRLLDCRFAYFDKDEKLLDACAIKKDTASGSTSPLDRHTQHPLSARVSTFICHHPLPPRIHKRLAYLAHMRTLLSPMAIHGRCRRHLLRPSARAPSAHYSLPSARAKMAGHFLKSSFPFSIHFVRFCLRIVILV